MNPRNPIQNPVVDPVGLDVNIEYLRNKLETIPWLDRTFGRAFDMQFQEGEKMVLLPQVYVGNKEYFSMMPNDYLKSFSFFAPIDPLENNSSEDDLPFNKTYFWNQAVDLIVFFNYDLVDKTKGYPFVENLKEDVLKVLQMSRGVTIKNVYSNDIKNVYKRWHLDLLSKELLYFPYGSMRIEMDIQVQFVGKKC